MDKFYFSDIPMAVTTEEKRRSNKETTLHKFANDSELTPKKLLTDLNTVMSVKQVEFIMKCSKYTPSEVKTIVEFLLAKEYDVSTSQYPQNLLDVLITVRLHEKRYVPGVKD